MKKIIPFSNGNEAMSWIGRNCELCRRSACYTKKALEKGFLTGTITEKQAQFIGLKDTRLNDRCNQFTTVRIPAKKKQPKEQTPKLF